MPNLFQALEPPGRNSGCDQIELVILGVKKVFSGRAGEGNVLLPAYGWNLGQVEQE